jgi:hypothetical protein
MPMNNVVDQPKASLFNSHRPAIVLFVLSWTLMLVVRLVDHYLWLMVRPETPGSPPLYPGVWMVAMVTQLAVTLAFCFGRFNIARTGFAVLIGYWICALLSCLASIFYSSGSLISGPK